MSRPSRCAEAFVNPPMAGVILTETHLSQSGRIDIGTTSGRF